MTDMAGSVLWAQESDPNRTVTLKRGRRCSHRGISGRMARANQGTPRCHTPRAAHGIHVGGGNTHTAPIFAARTVGWLLAGMIAQPALQLLWIPIRKVGSVQIDAVPSASVRNAVCAGAAMGLAILVAQLLGLHHASSAPRQRPPHAMTGLGRFGCRKATIAYGTAAGHCQTLQAGTTTIAFQSACANSNSQCVNELCLHDHYDPRIDAHRSDC